MKKLCRNCEYAIITIVYECQKKDDNGGWLHPEGYSPEDRYCEHWEQADPITLQMNSIDWSKARMIVVDDD